MLSALKLVLFGVVLLFSPIFASPAFAGDFEQIFIRLDRTQVNQSTGGLVCATPATAGVEAKIEITFPNGFSVNSTASNWTVSTSDLPNGASSWPGIGTASLVSSQTVTFPSGDLNVGQLYCFNFSEVNTLTNSSSVSASNTAAIITKVSNNVVIDDQEISLHTTASDQITVSARVGANANEFITRTGNQSQKEKYAQDETIEYDITYGSFLPYATNFVLEASWSLGIVDEAQIPTVDLLDYVVGSASNAYRNTPAVIDLADRKIRWHISNFPGDTLGEKVTFKLRTKSAYTGSKDVHFEVSSRIIYDAENVITAGSIKSDVFRYDFNRTPGPPPTPVPSAAPGINPPKLVFENIEIRQIDSSSILLFVDLGVSSAVTLKYGTAMNKLTSTFKSIPSKPEHEIKIDGLDPDTIYFFTLEALNEKGRIVRSDLFTFKTAKVSKLSDIDPQTLVLTSSQVIIHSPSANNFGTTPFVVVPSGNILEFKFSIKDPGSVTQIQTIQRLSQVLGITSVRGAEANTDLTSAMEMGDGSYFSRLRVPKRPGFYEVFAKVYDQNGNIGETLLFKLKVVEPLKILNSSATPVENAKVYLYFYNERKRVYELISPQAINIQNPMLTNHNGTIETVLPKGNYRAEVLALGFKEKKINFTVGEGSEEGYPTITLENAPYGIGTAIKYYSLTAVDIFLSTSAFLNQLSLSIRFFDFIFLVLLGVLVFLALVSYSLRTHTSILHLPQSVLNEIRRVFTKHNTNDYISGTIYDQDNKSGLRGVSLYILDDKNSQIIGEIKTNSSGDFIFRKPKSEFRLMALKKGYEVLEDITFSDKDQGHLKIGLTKKEELGESIFKNLKYMFSNFLGLSFEALIFLSFIFEILFIFTFGIYKALPLLVISLLNLFIWFRFLYRHKNLI